MLASALLAVFVTSGERSDVNFVSSVVTHRSVETHSKASTAAAQSFAVC